MEEEAPTTLEKGTLQRLRQITKILVRHGFFDIVQRMKLLEYVPLSSRLLSNKFKEERKIPRKVRLRLVLTELGPTFIKLGQFLSTRPDIVPSEVIEELEKLQDRIPPAPFKEARGQIRKGLGRPIGDVFSWVEETPLGTASIGQVHKAKLLSGKTVIIKFKRPGVEEVIKEDIQLMTFLASLLERYFPNEPSIYKPTEIVKQFTRMIRGELDYKREARNLERTRYCFENDPNIYIPKTYTEYTTKDALVQDFVVGRKLNHISKKKVGKETINKIVNAYMRQVLEFGLFQADPHLGNIFLRKDGTIGIIDFGAVGSIDKEMQERMGRWLTSIIRNDIRGVVDIIFDMGVTTPQTNLRYLNEDVTEFTHDYADLPVDDIDVQRIYMDLIDIIKKNRLRFPPRFLLLLRLFTTIEGMIRQFDPDFNLTRSTGAYIEELTEKRERPERVVTRNIVKITKASRFIETLAPLVYDIIERTREGRLKVELDHINLDREISKLDTAINKIAMSAIVSSLVIGSSLVLVSDKGPIVYGFPAVGIGGLVIAAFLGSIVILRILGSREV